jgi:CHAT domain-containing protein/tetratricopeptide (TPR) repeat protein
VHRRTDHPCPDAGPVDPGLQQLSSRRGGLKWISSLAIAVVLAAGQAAVPAAPRAPAGPAVPAAQAAAAEGDRLAASGRFLEAEAAYRRSIDALTAGQGGADDRSALLATALKGLGKVLVDRGRYGAAATAYAQAEAIMVARGDSDQTLLAEVLHDRAELQATLGRHADAELLYRRALKVREAGGGRPDARMAASLVGLAALLRELNRYDEIEPLSKKALAILEATPGPAGPEMATAIGQWAVYLRSVGRYAEAEPLARRALSIDESALGPAHPKVAASINRLAGLMLNTGRNVEAEQLFRRALAMRIDALGAEHPDVATSLNNLAALLSQRAVRRYDEAEPMLRQALASYEAAFGNDHPLIAAALNNLAGLLQRTRRAPEAEQLFRRALDIRERMLSDEHPLVTISRNNLVALLDEQGRRSESEPLLLRAYQTALAGDVPEFKWRVLNTLRDHYSTDQPALAVYYGKLAVNTLQGLRQGFVGSSSDARQRYIDKVASVYESLAGLLVHLGRLYEAEQVHRMLKEEEYFDYVRRSTADDPRSTRASGTSLEKQWTARYAQISDSLATLGRDYAAIRRVPPDQRTSEQAARYERLQADLVVARQAFNDYLGELKTAFASERGEIAIEFGQREVESLRAMQGTLQRLGEGVVLLHYFVTPRQVHILVTTPDVQVARTVDLSRAELNARVSQFRQTLQNPRLDPRRNARALYDVLVRPVESDLKQAKARMLMVSLDGTLRYIPMAALHDGQRWLTETYALSIFTPAAKASLLLQNAPQWRVAGLGVSEGGDGFPPLPSVPVELGEIVQESTDPASAGGALPGIRRLDHSFTAATLTDALEAGYPVIHIASHFRFNPGTDADSYLLLGQQTRLTMADFRSGAFPLSDVDLLTLSACETALGGADANGREVEGFGALAQNQGAKSVIATLWAIADGPTGTFMARFYAARNVSQLDKASALQRSQLAFIRGRTQDGGFAGSTGLLPARGASRTGDTLSAKGEAFVASPGAPFEHPYFWAPFILMGNWL